MSKITHNDTKPRSNGTETCDYSVKSCDSGGKYQELRGMGALAEVTKGSRVQRITENNYCKTYHDEKPDNSIEGMIGKADTGGPPFDNVSRPKRTM